MARPVGAVVLIAAVSDRNFTPRSRKLSSRAMRSRKLRPSLSSFHTVNVSPACKTLRQRSRAGRFAVAPDNPSSLKCFALVTLERGKLQGGGLVVSRDAGISVFQPPRLFGAGSDESNVGDADGI